MQVTNRFRREPLDLNSLSKEKRSGVKLGIYQEMTLLKTRVQVCRKLYYDASVDACIERTYRVSTSPHKSGISPYLASFREFPQAFTNATVTAAETKIKTAVFGFKENSENFFSPVVCCETPIADVRTVCASAMLYTSV